MYNEDQKMRFIESYSDSESLKKSCKATFNSIEKYENEWCADFCTKDSETLQPVVNEILGIRSVSKRLRLSIMCDYVRWCIEIGVSGACDGIFHVSISGIEKMKRQTVTNPLQLQTYLDNVFDKEDDETIDNIYRCYCWLAFGGATESEAICVKSSDVDMQNMLVNIGGYYQIPIYREALPAFRNCVGLKMFVYKHPNYSKTTYKHRADGECILRGITGGSMSEIRIRTELSRRSKIAMESNKTDLQLSYSRILMSGLFYRMYEREMSGFPVDFFDIAKRLYGNKNYNLQNANYTIDAKMRKLAKNYEKDYENWKMTF